MVKLQTKCPNCGKINEIIVTDEEYNNYINKTDLIQNIFPDLSPTIRETLLTGYCQKCWNEIFPLEEDDE